MSLAFRLGHRFEIELFFCHDGGIIPQLYTFAKSITQ